MTPYLEDRATGAEASSPARKAQPPKSIMVHGDHKTMTTATSNAGNEGADPDPSPTMASNGGVVTSGRTSRNANLKRVSFGSLKGSMVETLIYDHQDEVPDHLVALVNGQEGGPSEAEEEGPSRVRVTLYEAERPHLVLASPETPDIDFELMSVPVVMAANGSPKHQVYVQQLSTDSGLDNPFRPDGELSKEADTIVSLIKEGKPITPVKGEPDGGLFDAVDNTFTSASPPAANGDAKISPSKAPSPVAAEKKPGVNGSTPASTKKGPGVVEVQHGIVVPPSDSTTVEQVVIKKKPKCKCCVIQ